MVLRWIFFFLLYLTNLDNFLFSYFNPIFCYRTLFAHPFCIHVNAFAATSLYSFLLIQNAKTRPILASQRVFKITWLLLKTFLGEEKAITELNISEALKLPSGAQNVPNFLFCLFNRRKYSIETSATWLFFSPAAPPDPNPRLLLAFWIHYSLSEKPFSCKSKTFPFLPHMPVLAMLKARNRAAQMLD